MSKRLLAILLSLVMIFGLIPTSIAFALPNSTATLTVKADKAEVNPGDTINFSVELQQTGNINTLEATISLPDGLTLVPGSLTAINRSDLGWDDFGVTEAALLFSGYGSVSYTGTEPVVVATFKCTVDADAVGKYTVTLVDYVADDENYETKNPTVVSKEINVVVPVTGVTLDKDTLALDTGDNKTATLVATVDPNKATDKTVTWDSSDKTVATVENGVVTALKHGTTTITVKTVDGGFTDVCVVTVTCAHTAKTLTNAKTANCQEGGWDAYYTCDACGQLFAADGTTQINAIPTTSKDGNNHTNIQPFAADTATCVHMGNNAYEKCVDCGVVTSGSDKKFYGEHNYGELKTAVLETHTPDTLKPGVAAHYQCSVCNKYFTEAKVETTLEALTGTTPSHSYGSWINTDADQHWKACGCGNKIEIGDHEYDNTCDTTCNTCGHVRTITHTWSNTWSTDGTNHWKECTVCHDKKDFGTHTGGTATCQAKKECSVCHLTYGDFAACDYVENHDAKYLVSKATCVAEAVYKKSCSVCGTAHATETFKHGTVDATNHVGGTYVDGQRESDCMTPGYTGDKKCNSCHTIVTPGTDLPIGSHVPASVWSTDETHHWKDCQTVGCGNLIDKAEHSGGEATCIAKAVCSVCGAQYGEVDASNHKHTEVRDAKDATCSEAGYTGDTWCTDCNKKVAEGKDIEKLEHKPVLVKAEDATASKEGNIEYYYCENCGKYYSDETGAKEIAKEATVIAKLAPKIIDGNNAKVDKSSKEPVSFRSDAAFADFIRVELDGKELVRDKDYTLKEGSIIATLTPEFVATLTAGEHTLGIVSASGTAVANFAVTADNASNTVSDNNSEKSPQTGDNSNIILWSIVAVISLAALCTTAIVSKKKKVR